MAAKNDVSGCEKGGESGAGEEIQRWTAGRKAAIVLDLIKGKVTAADVARQHDLTVAEVESWIDRFVEGGREGLRTVPKDADARFDAERLQLLAKVGELTLQVDALKKKSNSQAINALTTLNGTAQSS
ncbi:MAG: transposase [Phycisphaerales bacterium]